MSHVSITEVFYRNCASKTGFNFIIIPESFVDEISDFIRRIYIKIIYF